MHRLTLIALSLAATTGCIIYADNEPDTIIVDDGPDPVYNSEPYVFDGQAGCYYDRAYGDDIVWFDAFVDDPDGTYDVVQVWADVYDDWTGELVQSFELYPTDDPREWYSDWLVSTTWIDCWYPSYSVDLVAYDSYDAWGVLTIWPETY